MAKLGEQRLGQRNLLGKTKVMITKSLKARELALIREGNIGAYRIRAVSFQKNAVVFLRVRRKISLRVAGFPRKAPHRAFPLTQIEMAISFPLDSSTCESRKLFPQRRCSCQRFCSQFDGSSRRPRLLPFRRGLPEASSPYCGALQRKI